MNKTDVKDTRITCIILSMDEVDFPFLFSLFFVCIMHEYIKLVYEYVH